MLSQYQNSNKAGIMCFTMPKCRAKAPAGSSPIRRLTFNVHGTEAISSLKRALNIGLFLAPTGIHLHGDGFPGGKRDIYLSAAIQRSLRKLFNDLCRGETTLNRTCFQYFLETEQGEPPDKASIMLTEDTYRFEQFLEVWWRQFGLEIERPISIADKDLTKPISNYFIDSSHNTYLPGHQWSGKATVETYKRALRQGCRCVEIDVWDNDIAPSRDKSSTGSAKGIPRSERSQKFSTNTLHTAAAHIKGAVDDKIEQTRQFLGVEKVHSHSPRCSKFDVSNPSPGCENALTPGLADADSDERVDVERPTGRWKTALPRDEPIVMHGWTFNQPIGFRQVCKAIREVAFETTHLPIIVSLEVHAHADQQERMVEIMKEEWAGLLVERPHEACPNGAMPRLEELLDKILVKVKKASFSTESSMAVGSLSPKAMVVDCDAASGPEDDRSTKRPQPKVLICENLSNLAVYTHSEHFVNFESSSAKIPSHIYSISENKILDLWESKRDELFTHNRHFFMRAYPKAIRVNSSNPDPSQFWRKGVQMVAMNWQKWDEGMMLNKAMFSGEHGWVLKPTGYRSHDEEPNDKTTHLSRRPFDLIITVLAGQHIPLPEGMPHHKSHSLRPLVKCELHVEKPEERSGSPGEGGIKFRPIEWKRQTSSGRTDHPEFGINNRELCFKGIPIVEESLSFVRFRVEHEESRFLSLKDTFAGWACIRLDRLATGYRLISLLDPDGFETKGVLLVKVLKNYR
ncbi:PLC-like phosphodiesterase [Ustulina deusta]|nr:PLC-like phosphodiesterase [Ustulina deusta]